MNQAMYILVNEDIKIGKGKLAGQVGHAVCSYLYYNYIKNFNSNKGKAIDLSSYMIAQKR